MLMIKEWIYEKRDLYKLKTFVKCLSFTHYMGCYKAKVSCQKKGITEGNVSLYIFEYYLCDFGFI